MNAVFVLNSYDINETDEYFTSLRDATLLSAVHGISGYLQFIIDNQDQERKASTWNQVLNCPTELRFALENTSVTLQIALDVIFVCGAVFDGLLGRYCSLLKMIRGPH